MGPGRNRPLLTIRPNPRDSASKASLPPGRCAADGGSPLAKLNPWEAQRLKLLALPQSDTGPVSADPQWWQNLWLGPWDGSMVGVGIVGDYEDLRPLVQHYEPDAADIFFPFPAKLADSPKQGVGQLLIVFTRQGIRRAASEAQGADERHDPRPRNHL
jgi:hypothetical protein